MEALCFTSSGKFYHAMLVRQVGAGKVDEPLPVGRSGFTFSVEKLMQMAPSLRSFTGTLKWSPGTPLMTISDSGRQSSNLQSCFSSTS